MVYSLGQEEIGKPNAGYTYVLDSFHPTLYPISLVSSIGIARSRPLAAMVSDTFEMMS